MKRVQRKLHPWIWLLVGVTSGLMLWFGVSVRSDTVPVPAGPADSDAGRGVTP